MKIHNCSVAFPSIFDRQDVENHLELHCSHSSGFVQQHRPSQALYAHVSQIPPNAESSSLTATIFGLTEDLARPEAADPETRLRILTIRGMLEVNYDAASARSTWTQVTWLTFAPDLDRTCTGRQRSRRAIRLDGAQAGALGFGQMDLNLPSPGGRRYIHPLWPLFDLLIRTSGELNSYSLIGV